MKTATCRVCKKKFVTSKKRKKICSDECLFERWGYKGKYGGIHYSNCVVCGKEFKLSRKRRKMCSDECVENQTYDYGDRYKMPTVSAEFGSLLIKDGDHNREISLYSKTLDEIGEEIGLSRKRAGQICIDALIKFKRNWIKMYGKPNKETYDMFVFIDEELQKHGYDYSNGEDYYK